MEFTINRILTRESSIGQSSRIFYRACDGVPFQWETRPGTPKHPQQEEDIPPLSPSPLMQSLGLPLPNIDHHDENDKGSVLKLSTFKKMVKNEIMKKVEKLSKRGNSKQKQESSSFGDSDGEFMASVKDSSFSSYNSSSLSFSPNCGVMDSSSSRTIDGPLCCSPWNFYAILDEGNTRIYYCRQHKTAITLEEDGLYLSKILSRVSSSERFSGPFHYGITDAGVPFNWEMQPGTPKNAPENEPIPPPSPPPALQNSYMPRPRLHVGDEEAKKSTWKKKVRFWVKRKHEMKQSERKCNELSFRHHENEICWSDQEGFDASFRDSGSSSHSKGIWRMPKIKWGLKGGYFSWGSWNRKEVLGLARKKLKSLTF